MVGKSSEQKGSRIYQQCYVKCCKLQNLTPLNGVLPTDNGKVLDFCVDRIKYADWPPILNALSCDLSLHSVAMRCRQPVKTVLEHIDCERLAKTVNKRAVILTNFMLSNLVEAIAQMLCNTTLLTSLLLEGLPLKVPYLNPLCETLLSNNSLQHLYLPRCLIGDAGCMAVCKAVRCLPNILTLDLSGCELTPLGAGYIADLVKYQKIHRYSENWIHTLRYRLPQLDTMAGLRRITVCGNPQLGDAGVAKLFDVLTDDLWIKALDIQNCNLTDESATSALKMMRCNTTLVVLDMRHNPDVSLESMSRVRVAVRENEKRGSGMQYPWLPNGSCSSSDGRSVKSAASKNGLAKEHHGGTWNTRHASNKSSNKTVTKKDKDYTETLQQQLQEEISHRQQLEELNQQLVDQMKQLKHQQVRLWQNNATSSCSEQSFQASSRSGDLSSSSGSTSSVPIDQNTLSYIQQAFKDIYTYIKNNQCHGQCISDIRRDNTEVKDDMLLTEIMETVETEEVEPNDLRINMHSKKSQSTHAQLADNTFRKNKTTKSAHLLRNNQSNRHTIEMKPDMFEKQMGDSKKVVECGTILQEENIVHQSKSSKNNSYEKISPCPSVVSDSSDTLVCTPRVSHRSRSPAVTVNPREAFYSSSEDEDRT